MGEIINLNTEQLRNLQLIELEMLIEVDRICRKNNINYTLFGGTLLGAVRHKGFIPWDDDLDVAFLYSDYQKFRECCKSDLDTTRFFLQDYTTDSNYRWGYSKIRRIGTEYLKGGQEKLKQKTGICIDVFVFHNLPDEETERKKYKKKMFRIRKMAYSAMGRTNEKKLYMRMFYQCVYSLLPMSFINSIREKSERKYDSIITKNISHESFPDPNAPLGYNRNMMTEFCELEFEGMDFMATSHYHYYLSCEYGDYMTFPPVEQRKGVMDAVKYQMIDEDYETLKNDYIQHNRGM